MKKLVFSKEKCREVLLIKGRWDDDHKRDYKDGGWFAECEGKTEEEIEAMGYGVDEDWMVEV
jgi:hypothetical protein